MKVKMQQGYRDIYTLTDVDRAKAVIEAEKGDPETAKEWAVYAVNEALGGNGYCVEVLKAEAYTAKNRRAWDAYDIGTQDMDIWIDAIAETSTGFIKVGAYLTDIWRSGETEYRYHEYIEMYKKA